MIRWVGPLALLVAGCAGAPAKPSIQLPFHVAIIPVHTHQQGGIREGETPLQLEGDCLTGHIASVLAKNSFVRVSVLSHQDTGSADEATVEADWVREAVELDADLLLDCEVIYRPGFKSSANEKSWLNLPLFLLGGPFCYFVDDVSYSCDVSARLTCHETSPLAGGQATLRDGGARILETQASVRELALDFIDRSKSQPGWYLPTLLVPPSMIARNTESAMEQVQDGFAAGLADGIAASFQKEQQRLLLVERVWPFYLAPSARAMRTPTGCTFEGDVILEDDGTGRLDSYCLRVGTKEMRGDFGDVPTSPTSSTGRALRTYQIKVEVDYDGKAEVARLEVVEGGRMPRSRTFTVPISHSY